MDAAAMRRALRCGRAGCPCKSARGNVHCPAHDDANPSLSVTEGQGKVLAHCHAGCDQDRVVEALRERNLWAEPGRNGDRPKGRQRVKQTRYAVRDVEDHLVALHVREDRSEGKRFRWERPDGSKGLGGTPVGDLPLFGSQHLAALGDRVSAVVTEGEKAATALLSVGITAVGTVTGADGTPGAEALRPLVRFEVVLWPDADDVGQQHMARIAGRLTALGCLNVRLVDWPEAPQKGDAADAVAQDVDVRRLIAEARPWQPDTVNLAALLDYVAAFFRRFVVLTAHQADTLALWTAHTHAIDAAETTPYLNVTSPEKESGKTRTGEVATTLVASPLAAESISTAALAHSVDMGATLILDEVDTIFGKSKGAPSEAKEMLRGVLDSGWRRGGQYVRMVGQGANMTPHRFKTFGAKMLIGIGTVPGTLGSRSVRIELRRRRRDTERIERFRIRKTTPEGHTLRDQLSAWACAHMEELRLANPVLPEELSDRMWDSWEPLLAIADLAGGSWPARARKAAVTISGNAAAEDESAGVRLLADLQEFFAGKPLGTVDLLGQLNTREESAWGTWNEGKGMRSHDLARLLKRFGIRPHSVRVTTGTLKGYHPDDFDDAFARYLPGDREKRVTPSRVSVSGHFPPIVEQNVIPAAQEGASYECDGVTDKLGGYGEEDGNNTADEVGVV